MTDEGQARGEWAYKAVFLWLCLSPLLGLANQLCYIAFLRSRGLPFFDLEWRWEEWWSYHIQTTTGVILTVLSYGLWAVLIVVLGLWLIVERLRR